MSFALPPPPPPLELKWGSYTKVFFSLMWHWIHLTGYSDTRKCYWQEKDRCLLRGSRHSTCGSKTAGVSEAVLHGGGPILW